MVTINLDSYDLAPTVREDLECIAQHDGVISEEDISEVVRQRICASRFHDPQIRKLLSPEKNQSTTLTRLALRKYCEQQEHDKLLSELVGTTAQESELPTVDMEPMGDGITILDEKYTVYPIGQAALEDGNVYELYVEESCLYEGNNCPLDFDYETGTFCPTEIDLEKARVILAYVPASAYDRYGRPVSDLYGEQIISLEEALIPLANLAAYVRLQGLFVQAAVQQIRETSEANDEELVEMYVKSVSAYEEGRLHSLVDVRNALLTDICKRNLGDYGYECSLLFLDPNWWLHHKWYGLGDVPTPIMDHIDPNSQEGQRLQKLQEVFQASCVRARLDEDDAYEMDIHQDAFLGIPLLAAGIMVDALPDARQEALFSQWARRNNFDSSKWPVESATFDFLLSDIVQGHFIIDRQVYWTREYDNSWRWRCVINVPIVSYEMIESSSRDFKTRLLLPGDLQEAYRLERKFESCLLQPRVIQTVYQLEPQTQDLDDVFTRCLDGIVRE